MTRQITVREATVKTATIEVKALTISARQVTLSVFRQLYDEDLIDPDTADLRGVPWGVVNYFWGACAKASEHLHVVWQKGDELRRACVYPEPSSARGWTRRRNAYIKTAQCLVAATVLQDRTNHPYERHTSPTGTSMNKVLVHVGNQLDWIGFSDDVDWLSRNDALPEPSPREAVVTRWDYRTRSDVPMTEEEIADAAQRRDEYEVRRIRDYAQTNARKEDAVRRFLTDTIGTVDQRTARSMAEESAAILGAFAQKWEDQYTALSSLDHLFIAV